MHNGMNALKSHGMIHATILVHKAHDGQYGFMLRRHNYIEVNTTRHLGNSRELKKEIRYGVLCNMFSGWNHRKCLWHADESSLVLLYACNLA